MGNYGATASTAARRCGWLAHASDFTGADRIQLLWQRTARATTRALSMAESTPGFTSEPVKDCAYLVVLGMLATLCVPERSAGMLRAPQRALQS